MGDDQNAKSILIAEDNHEQAQLYAGWLEDEYAVTVVNDGEQALEQYDSSIDLLLLDRRMPTPGDEVLSELRSRGETVPVVMLTAVDPDEDIVDMPFEKYLVKPVSRTKVLETVRTVLEKRESEIDNDVLDALGSSRARQLLLALRAEPRTAKELQRATGYSLPTIYRRLNDLQQAGLITEGLRVATSGNHTRTFELAAAEIRISIESGFPADIRPPDSGS